MAIKWAWGFSTDQSTAKLNEAGWSLGSTGTVSSSQTHTYVGDAVTKRAMFTYTWSAVMASSPPGVAALDGWVAIPTYIVNHIRNYLFWGVQDSSGMNGGVYLTFTSTSTAASSIKLYLNNVYKASGGSFLVNRWNYVALKYECSTGTFAGTVYLDGVEIIARQTQGGATAWTDATTTKVWHEGAHYPSGGGACHWAGVVTYDSLSDAGQTEVWCSTMEPTGDDSETGTWAPSTGATNFGVTTPWDTATYTENTAPASGTDKVVMTCPNIATHLGITPTVYGLVSHAVVSGGSDFNALFNDGSTTLTGSAVTSDANDPTYGYATKSGGVTAGTTVKIGTKIP